LLTADNYRLIGRLAKLHGIEGEALLISSDIFPKKIDKTEQVFLIIDELPVPFFISIFRLRSDNSAILKFTDINTAEEMEEFIGVEVAIEDKRKRKTLSFNPGDELKGFQVFDENRKLLGIVESLLNFQDNYLVQVYHDKKEILIPFNENTVISIDNQNKSILMQIPDGLLNLY
jgi:16S rRNA processing protein RimM